MIVVAIVGIIASIAIPNLLDSRISGNEASAVGTVRNLNSAQHTYSLGIGSGKYGNLTTLQSHRLVDSVVASGRKDGYDFAITLGSAATSFTIEARPVSYNFSGTRSFFTDLSGVIRYTTADSPATTASGPLGT